MNIPNNQSSLDTWIDWLLHLHATEIDLGLTRIAQVADKMGVTRPAPFVISVAGTNGKGSSVAMLSAILQAGGYRVGTYTSPHIESFTERVQINREPVSEQQIVDAFYSIEKQRKDTKLTYFEFSTLAALKIFSESELDIVVLEVGLGGRLDAVNVVDADAALITAIDIDHVEWLGDDRNVIAVEKAGIMRSGKVAVCSDPQVPQTLVDYAADLDVDLSLLGNDFEFSVHQNANGWCFTGLAGQTSELPNPALKGSFQFQNAAGVLALLQKIELQLPVSSQAVNKGLITVRHPGRLEKRHVKQQSWLIDVAHNPQSAGVLAEYLADEQVKQGSKTEKPIAIFSALSDKDMLPMVQQVAPFVSQWLIADLAIPRATSVNALRDTLLQAGINSENIEVANSIAEAVGIAKLNSHNDVLAWGSFFTVAQVINALGDAGL